MFNKPLLLERTIKRLTGTEGPREDPYGWTAFKVHMAYKQLDGSVKQIIIEHHCGLDEWVQIRDGQKIRANVFKTLIPEGTPYWTEIKVLDTALTSFFEAVIGMDVHSLELYWNRMNSVPSKCPMCGSRKVKYGSGFVGEAMVFCKKCGQLLWEEEVTPAMVM